MPLVEFDGDNAPHRYKSEVWKLLQRGYNEHLKRGEPFCIRNIVNADRKIVLLPLRYLAEVRAAPQNKLNWKPIHPYPIILQLFARMSSRVMVGQDLCGDEWQKLSLQYMSAILAIPSIVKKQYHPWFYWLAKYTSTDVKNVWKFRKQCADYIHDTLEARHAAFDGDAEAMQADRPNDFIQWLMEEHRARGNRATADQVVQNIFITMVASIHSSASLALSVLYDLLDHPDTLEEIRQEISKTKERFLGQSRVWTRQALGELQVLDSAMRETLRVHPFTEVTVQRLAVVDYTFADGRQIPAGTQVAFTSLQHSLDPDVHPDAHIYDPKRWLKRRDEVNYQGFHFPATSDDWINWGSGSHVCPGRFLADVTLKLIFVQLLSSYEIRYPGEVQKRPADKWDNFSILPDMTVPLLFKELSSTT
ncbi:cytochrome P450 [Stachybotrys elegans]|uniref:Cytochrome P450 n=1 Tax=Stachybotrys elegans TaxID=80388 RepID=A0A8K0SU19_9HYPO|nr:cytochrome P450 [Stachybotrys elegans]